MDHAVAAAFSHAQPDVTVLAVGGYGRAELFPYSDVDLLLLVDKVPDQARDKEPISEFLRILWDEGLRISQSVRTVADCCELHDGNLELTISLLDRRYICGELTRFADLERRFPRFLASQRNTVAHELTKATRARHAEYQETIHHLEPNVKEHPGALRDVHVIHWLAKIEGTAAQDLAAARQFLYSIRLSLHDHFRRDNNLLNFATQESIFEDPSESMRTYYRGAREILRAVGRAIDVVESANAGLLAQFRDWRGRISNTEFTVSRERVFLRDPQRLEADPGLIMRLMLFLSRHKLQIAPDTERRLRACTPVTPLWAQMRELLSLPHCTFALRVMHDTGLLEKIVPEWERIDCLVVRDFYHRYTVDEHTLLTLQAIDDLAAAREGLRTRFEIGRAHV